MAALRLWVDEFPISTVDINKRMYTVLKIIMFNCRVYLIF